METVIHVATEVGRAVKPWASPNEDTAREPFWTVVARRSAAIRRSVVVSVGTCRLYSHTDGNLSRRFRSGDREAKCSNSS